MEDASPGRSRRLQLTLHNERRFLPGVAPPLSVPPATVVAPPLPPVTLLGCRGGTGSLWFAHRGIAGVEAVVVCWAQVAAEDGKFGVVSVTGGHLHGGGGRVSPSRGFSRRGRCHGVAIGSQGLQWQCRG